MARHIYLDRLEDFYSIGEEHQPRADYSNPGANMYGDSALNAVREEELAALPLKPERNIGRGIMVGAVAGIVGCIAMDLFSRAWISAQQGGETNEAQKHMTHHGARPDSLEAMEQAGQTGSVEHSASTRTADAATPTSLDEDERADAGKLVHYAFGAAAGAVYGALSEAWPTARFGFGIPFGLAVWAATVPTSLPALGLARKPDEYEPHQHAFGIGSHIAWGAATEATRRAFRAA